MNPWNRYAPELVTDLYEFTMAESYFKERMSGEATFSLFIRAYPPQRAYFVAAGLEHLLELLSTFSFGEESLRYLASTKKFTDDFLHYLSGLRFTGTVRALPEGRIFFTQEPILEVTAPLVEGQLVETLILNVIQLETLLAGKAARCVHAARGRSLVDFSLRRTQGVDAGLKAARASYLAGFAGTSNVLAGKLYDIPVFGTMAHSYITSFKNEMESFLAFARTYPENTVLLIDTYDTLRGAEKAVEVGRRMAARGQVLRGVRLDSGDLVDLSRKVRRILVDGGFPDVKILVSGSLDEYSLETLLDEGAEVDMFAVGTRMGVSSDAPYFDIAYKLVEYEGRPILKLSSGKKTWVGKKQAYRFYDDDGCMQEDVLCLEKEPSPGGEPLLQTVLRGGALQRSPESLETIRGRFREEWEKLPAVYRSNSPTDHYPVKISPALQELERKTSEERRRQEIDAPRDAVK